MKKVKAGTSIKHVTSISRNHNFEDETITQFATIQNAKELYVDFFSLANGIGFVSIPEVLRLLGIFLEVTTRHGGSSCPTETRD